MIRLIGRSLVALALVAGAAAAIPTVADPAHADNYYDLGIDSGALM